MWGYKVGFDLVKSLFSLSVSFFVWETSASSILAADTPTVNKTEECELLVIGGGLSGVAASYEALLAGKTVCMTEITDWVGGQIKSW